MDKHRHQKTSELLDTQPLLSWLANEGNLKQIVNINKPVGRAVFRSVHADFGPQFREALRVEPS
jgi:hypothetical protein